MIQVNILAGEYENSFHMTWLCSRQQNNIARTQKIFELENILLMAIVLANSWFHS